MGGEVEGDRDALLPAGKGAAIEGVRVLGGGEAGILPDRPWPAGIHRRPRPAQERRQARQRAEMAQPLEIGLGVERLDRDPFERGPGQLRRIAAAKLRQRPIMPRRVARHAVVLLAPPGPARPLSNLSSRGSRPPAARPRPSRAGQRPRLPRRCTARCSRTSIGLARNPAPARRSRRATCSGASDRRIRVRIVAAQRAVPFVSPALPTISRLMHRRVAAILTLCTLAAAPVARAQDIASVDTPAASEAQELSAVERWRLDPTQIFDGSEVTLAEFLYVARPVVVFADSPNDPRYLEQIEYLLDRIEDLVIRDVVIIADTDPAALSPVRADLEAARLRHRSALEGRPGRATQARAVRRARDQPRDRQDAAAPAGDPRRPALNGEFIADWRFSPYIRVRPWRLDNGTQDRHPAYPDPGFFRTERSAPGLLSLSVSRSAAFAPPLAYSSISRRTYSPSSNARPRIVR